MSDVKGYHAHVYYNTETKPAAAKLREAIIEEFKVEPGAMSDEPRGPHPISQFAVIFETPEFQDVVPWLMLNRDGLDRTGRRSGCCPGRDRERELGPVSPG